MDLLVAQVNKKGMIESNLKDVEKQLNEKLAVYQGIIVTEDTITQSKKDVAEIRKIRTSIDDARKDLKKEWMKPFEQFEAECKKLIELCDKPIDEINSQVKAFDEKRIAEKQAHLHELYEENIGDLKGLIPYEAVAKKQWNNASYKDSDILYDISEVKTRVRSALDAVHALNSEIEDELIKVLQDNNFDLTKAIQRNSQYIADKQRIQEQMADSESKTELAEAKKTESTAPVDQLHDLVDNLQTVKLIISKADADEVEGLLNLSGISYRIIEQ